MTTGRASASLGSNLIFNTIQWVWPIALTILVLPILVRGLGFKAYGAFAIISAAVHLMGFVNSGVGVGALKYVAESIARDDPELVDEILDTTLFLFGGIGIGIAALIFGLSRVLTQSVLHLSGELGEQSIMAFRLLGVYIAVRLVAGAFVAGLLGFQRYDILAWWRVGASTAVGLGHAALVTSDYDIATLALWTLLVEVVTAVGLAMALRRVHSRVAVGRGPRRRALKMLGSFSTFTLLEDASTLAVVQGDRLIVGNILGAAGAAFYTVPQALAQNLGHFLGSVCAPLVPRTSQLVAGADVEGLRILYLRTLRLVAWLDMSLAIPIIILSRPLLLHYLGPRMAAESAAVLALLVAGWGLLGLGVVATAFNLGTGHPRTNAITRLMLAVGFLSGCVALVPSLGVVGAGWSLIVSAGLTVPWLLFHTQRRLGVQVSSVLRGLVGPAVIAVVIGITAGAVRPLATNLLLAAALIGGLCLLSLGLASVTGVVTPEDRGFVTRLLSKQQRQPT